jgi:protein SCO1
MFRLSVAAPLAKAVAALPHSKGRPYILFVVCLACAFASLIGSSALAQVQGRPQLLRDVGIDQKLDGQVPLDLAFRDETGKTVQLAEYFGEKPVVLALVYYECPMLCTQVLNGLLRSFQILQFDVGKQFNVVTVSINPREKPDLARAKQEVYVGLYGRDGAAQGWHFLTGDDDQIRRLAKSVGYRYAYDQETGQYAHASGIMVLTPQGRISKYFYGIQYQPRDLRLGLVEASANKIGSPSDQLLLFCYHYDPATGKYGLVISNVLKVAGLVTVLGLGILLLALFRRERYTTLGKEGVRVDGHELQI